jgi:quercetin dioxygenase-like cupin family protein
MKKRSLIEELDRAVEGIITNPDAPLPVVDSRIAPLIRIAVELRDLATDDFGPRLKRDLLNSLPTSGQTATVDPDDGEDGEMVGPLEKDDRIGSTEKKPAAWPGLEPRDIAAALEGLGKAVGDPTGKTTRTLTSLNQCAVGVARYSDQTLQWAFNPDADELLHVLEGALDVTTLSDEGPVHTKVPEGSIFVCPRGIWHWPRPEPTASLLFVRPERGTEYSRAEVPRHSAARKVTPGRIRGSGAMPEARGLSAARGPVSITCDVKAALGRIPELAISDQTTAEQAGAAFPQLGSLNQSGLYAGRFSGLSPWERHTSGDELLHVLEGEVEITTLTDAGPLRNTLRAGTVFVCPRGLWHRQYSATGVLEFSATPQPTQVSFADDPRG